MVRVGSQARATTGRFALHSAVSIHSWVVPIMVTSLVMAGAVAVTTAYIIASPSGGLSGNPATLPLLAGLAVSPTNASLLVGSSENFSATALDTSGNPLLGSVSYNWSLTPTTAGNLSQFSGPSTEFVAGNAPTQAILTVSASYAGSVRSAAADIFVKSPPDLLISSFLASPSEIELGESTTFQVSTSEGSGQLIYTYSNLPPNCPAVNSPTLPCTPSGYGTFSVGVQVSDAFHQAARATTVLQVVGSGAELSISSFTAEPSSIGLGQATTFQASVTGGSGGYTFQYSGLPMGCSPNDGPTFACTPTKAGEYAVTLKVNDSGGNSTNATTSLNVTSESSPLTITSFVANPSNISLGASTSFIAAVTGGTGGYKYVYDDLPLGCASSNHPKFTCTPSEAGTFVVDLEVTDSSDREANASTTLNVSQGNLPLTISNFGASPPTIQLGEAATFEVSATGGSGTYTYVYFDLPSGCVSSNVSQIACTPSEEGSFLVTVQVTDTHSHLASAQTQLSVQGTVVSGCAQGSHTITVAPASGDMQATLLSDYKTLGSEGGGTLEFETGTYQIDESTFFDSYNDISFEGAGMGKTIITLPPDPVGIFKNQQGQLVGTYDFATGKSVGPSGNFITIGPNPVNNFEMCDLTLDAQADVPDGTESWSGTLLLDNGGGSDHVYRDISMWGFFYAGGPPNGLHVNGNGGPASGYVIEDISGNSSRPFQAYMGHVSGPQFFGMGNLADATVENLTGAGNIEIDSAPLYDCLVENVDISSYILVDPNQLGEGGSWGGTLFQNVTVDTQGTPAPDALAISDTNVSYGHGRSNFNDLRWNDDHFWGIVRNAENMVDVENSTFDGGLNGIPAIFDRNLVQMNTFTGIPLPIQIDGSPFPGTSVTMIGNTFVFPNGTNHQDPFQIAVPFIDWNNDTIEMNGPTSGFLFQAPGISLTSNSGFYDLAYEPLGGGAPSQINLFDSAQSPNFTNAGAEVRGLVNIVDNLPT
jgi:hypothetical protein